MCWSAVKAAIRPGVLSFDAVKHLVLCRQKGRPPRLALDLYPYLPNVTMAKTYASDYTAFEAGVRS